MTSNGPSGPDRTAHGAVDHAKLLYRRTLEERHADGGLEGILERLGLEPSSLGTAALGPEATIDVDDIGRVMTRLEEPGVIREILRAQTDSDADDGSFDLLLRLLDVADIHPPESLRRSLYGETPEEMARLLAALRRLGLFRVKSDGEHLYLLLQPWLKHVLADEIAELRKARSAEHRREAPDLPFEQTLALCVNYLRGRTIRLTSKGSMFQRDHRRAEDTFKTLYERAGRDAFLLGITVLERLGCLRFSGGILRINSDRARAVLGGDTELRIEALVEEQWDLPLAIVLLDELESRRRRDDGDDGWAPASHVITRGEIFVNTSGRVSVGSIERRTRDKLSELVALSLVAADERPFPATSYRITPSGSLLCASIYGEGDKNVEDGGGDAAEEAAIVQPNLDILVPLDAPAHVHWRVGCVAALKSIDTMCRYALEKEYAQCVFGREGSDVVEWIALLSSSAVHGVPENVIDTLRSWLTAQGVVQVFEGLVLVLNQSDNYAGRAALAEAAKKLKATQVGPGVFLTDSDASVRTVTTLEQHGLRVVASLKSTDGLEESAPPTAAVQRSGDPLEELRGQYGQARATLADFDSSVSRFLEEEATITAPSELAHFGDMVPLGAGAVGPWIDSSGADGDGTISTLVHEAVRAGRAIEIVLSIGPRETRWSIFPDSVLKRGSRTYVTGLCPEGEELRVFPLDEIRRARMCSS